MELLALDKPIKKPPRSDERDGDLFCGTHSGSFSGADLFTINLGFVPSVILMANLTSSAQYMVAYIKEYSSGTYRVLTPNTSGFTVNLGSSLNAMGTLNLTSNGFSFDTRNMSYGSTGKWYWCVAE